MAFVYGSVARQTETAKSDIDLRVVGKTTIDDIISHLTSVEKNIGRSINPTVYSVPEFEAKMADGNHFLRAVLKGQKVFLPGDEDELGKSVRISNDRFSFLWRARLCRSSSGVITTICAPSARTSE